MRALLSYLHSDLISFVIKRDLWLCRPKENSVEINVSFSTNYKKTYILQENVKKMITYKYSRQERYIIKIKKSTLTKVYQKLGQ